MQPSIRRNVGKVDRAVRIFIGILLAIYTFMKFSELTFVMVFMLVLSSAFLILEGFFGYCVLYGLMGWSTYSEKKKL